MNRALKRRAVALRYDPSELSAPLVVAKGQGFVAEKLIELAREHGIKVQEDPGLTELLMKVDINDEIPAALFGAVAKVLAAVYRVNQRLARDRGL